MILLFFLSSLCYSICTYNIHPNIGFSTFYHLIEVDEEICINITYFPFFIIFNKMPQNMKYLEYRSTKNTKDLTLFRSFDGEYLSYFFRIEYPFASITMFCPRGDFVSFSFGTFPGICKTGTHITNFRKYQFELSSKYQQKNSILPFDDKCVLFTSIGIQRIQIDYDLLGNLLIYKNAFDFQLLDGKGWIDFSVNSTSMPTLLRILIGNTTHSQRASFFIENDSPPPLNEFNVFYDPVNRTIPPCDNNESCDFVSKIDWELIGIILAFIIASLAVFSALFYVLSLLYCPNFIQHTPLKINELRTESSLSISPESMTSSNPEPRGYFAMDPILRPPD